MREYARCPCDRLLVQGAHEVRKFRVVFAATLKPTKGLVVADRAIAVSSCRAGLTWATSPLYLGKRNQCMFPIQSVQKHVPISQI